MNLCRTMDFAASGPPGAGQAPPPWGALRVIPLGGLGEFGKNAMVLEYAGDMMLIDCGQKFPEDEMLGVDMVIPDFAYILDNIERFRGLVLTHGHEDHIGAVPFLVRQCAGHRFPIYGSRLTLALVREKLVEMDLEDTADLIQLDGGASVSLGGFEVQGLPVAHSFPQSMALAIHTPIGIVVHTGDWRLERNDPAGAASLEILRAWGKAGRVVLLMADSTNVDREGMSRSEEEVKAGLEPVLAGAARTVILATFSSSLHRVQSVLDLAGALGRRVAVCGFSLERNFAIATELGLLRYADDQILTLQELAHLPARQRLILTTGTQGEPLSALSRLALGSFKGYTIQPDDLVVMSSRIIPGNEKAIYRMINHFYRHRARVVTERDAPVHGSGHACRAEMAELLDAARPRYFLPIHGELRHLIHHRDLAVERGLAESGVFVLENGMQLEVGEQAAGAETAWAGQMLVDGRVLEELEEVVLRDRKHLAEDGMITIVLVIDRASHQIIAGPDIVSRGFVMMDGNEALIQDCKALVVETFTSCGAESQEEWEVVKAAVRKALRRFLREATDRYPVILPVVVEI
ncbi:MAG: ribonuclease J [bacterium]|nr:ribonuclease J [bacterium]